MGLDKKLLQLMDCPLPTNNTHIITYTVVMGSRGHDRMLVGFATTYAISAYHH
jgi:hypothetical protein